MINDNKTKDDTGKITTNVPTNVATAGDNSGTGGTATSTLGGSRNPTEANSPTQNASSPTITNPITDLIPSAQPTKIALSVEYAEELVWWMNNLADEMDKSVVLHKIRGEMQQLMGEQRTLSAQSIADRASYLRIKATGIEQKISTTTTEEQLRKTKERTGDACRTEKNRIQVDKRLVEITAELAALEGKTREAKDDLKQFMEARSKRVLERLADASKVVIEGNSTLGETLGKSFEDICKDS